MPEVRLVDLWQALLEHYRMLPTADTLDHAAHQLRLLQVHVQAIQDSAASDLARAGRPGRRLAASMADDADLKPITAEELETRLGDPGIMVIDVRSAADYAHGHIPGALSVPATEMERRIGAMPPDREIIAYCQGPYCVLSPRMARLLHSHDVPARPLQGGLTRWQRRGGRVAIGVTPEGDYYL